MRASAIPIISVRGCGSGSGVGSWQKAVIITIGLVTTMLGVLLVYYGVRMWWSVSGYQENALQYLSDRIGEAESQYDLIRVDWEYEIIRMECAATRQPCDSGLVRRNRRSYRFCMAIGVFLVIFGLVGFCGATCENTTSLSLVVIVGCVVSLLEFGLMVVLFKSHYQMTSAREHALELMKQKAASASSDQTIPPVSLQQKEAFYRAMDWLDSLGNFDYSRVRSHFSERKGSSYLGFAAFLDDTLNHLIFGERSRRTPEQRVNSNRICPEKSPARMGRRSLVGDMMSGAEHIYKNNKRRYHIETEWLALAKQFDHIWNNMSMPLNERTRQISVEQNCKYTINKRIIYLLFPMEEMSYPVLVCGLITFLGFLLHAIGSPVAHLLVRALRNHYEDMISLQRQSRNAAPSSGVTVVNSTTTSSVQQQQQQQQQQPQQPMVPMQPLAGTVSGYMQPMQPQLQGSYAPAPLGYVTAGDPQPNYYVPQQQQQQQQQQQMPLQYRQAYLDQGYQGRSNMMSNPQCQQYLPQQQTQHVFQPETQHYSQQPSQNIQQAPQPLASDLSRTQQEPLQNRSSLEHPSLQRNEPYPQKNFRPPPQHESMECVNQTSDPSLSSHSTIIRQTETNDRPEYTKQKHYEESAASEAQRSEHVHTCPIGPRDNSENENTSIPNSSGNYVNDPKSSALCNNNANTKTIDNDDESDKPHSATVEQHPAIDKVATTCKNENFDFTLGHPQQTSQASQLGDKENIYEVPDDS